MTPEEQRAGALRALHRVAPEADLAALDPTADIREELDIDSVGILEFAAGIFRETGVEVPERDYPRIVTLDGCLAYLAAARVPRT